MFKSYYVVWKQKQFDHFELPVNSLNRTMQYGNAPTAMERLIQIAFKSYYVVWKQAGKKEKYKKYQGLNRTMQYGNYNIKINKMPKFLSLNRTMQYGNWKIGKKWKM